MSSRSVILSISLVVLVAGSAVAQETTAIPEDRHTEASLPYYRDYKRGWYWYEKEKMPRKEAKEDKLKSPRLPSLKDYTASTLWDMHPDDFQTLLMDFQKKAVMSPTEDNVAEYYYVQDIARRKSLAFANVAATVMQKYPQLSVARDYPTAVPGRNALTRQQRDEITKKIEESRADYGLIYFYSPACQYCIEQEGIVRYFEERYGWEVKRMDTTQDTHLSSMFDITVTPTIILLHRDTPDPIIVSTGVVSLSDMEERIFRGVRLLAGEISPEEYSLYEFQRGGAFDVKAPLRQREGGEK